MTSNHEFFEFLPEPAHGLENRFLRLTDVKKLPFYIVDVGPFANFWNLSVFLLMRDSLLQLLCPSHSNFIGGFLPTYLLYGGISFIS